MPAGYDAEVAELFRDFRAASNLTEADLAARLSARIEVVQALEQGALYALPPWAETCRVVNNYGLLLNLDVRPLLRRIYAQVEAGIVELTPKPMLDVPFMMPPEAREPEFQRSASAPMAPRGGAPAPLAPRGGVPAPMAPQRPAPYPPPQRPNAPPRQAAPAPDRRMQPRAPQPEAPQPEAPQPEAPQPEAPRPAAPQARPLPPPVQQPAPQAAAKAKRPRRALLKWGTAVLLVIGLGFGLWMLLDEPKLFNSSTSSSGSKTANPGAPPAKPLDPDDPRNRKADRLPSPSGF